MWCFFRSPIRTSKSGKKFFQEALTVRIIHNNSAKGGNAMSITATELKQNIGKFRDYEHSKIKPILQDDIIKW